MKAMTATAPMTMPAMVPAPIPELLELFPDPDPDPELPALDELVAIVEGADVTTEPAVD